MSACGTRMLSEWKPKTRADSAWTQSASGGLSTVMTPARVERAVEEVVPARAHRAHGGAVVLRWPSRCDERPQVQHAREEQQERRAREGQRAAARPRRGADASSRRPPGGGAWEQARRARWRGRAATGAGAGDLEMVGIWAAASARGLGAVRAAPWESAEPPEQRVSAARVTSSRPGARRADNLGTADDPSRRTPSRSPQQEAPRSPGRQGRPSYRRAAMQRSCPSPRPPPSARQRGSRDRGHAAAHVGRQERRRPEHAVGRRARGARQRTARRRVRLTPERRVSAASR